MIGVITEDTEAGEEEEGTTMTPITQSNVTMTTLGVVTGEEVVIEETMVMDLLGLKRCKLHTLTHQHQHQR